MKVYVIYRWLSYDKSDDGILLGIYSSRELAESGRLLDIEKEPLGYYGYNILEYDVIDEI